MQQHCPSPSRRQLLALYAGLSTPIDSRPAALRWSQTAECLASIAVLTIDTVTDGSVAAIEIVSDMVVVEGGEGFQNAYDDSGYDAYYGLGSVERFPQNGVTMGGDALLEQPIVIKKKYSSRKAKRYALWALIRVLHERFRRRARLYFSASTLR